MALDGATGAELWRRYSVHEIFSLNCNSDLDGDGLTDCIGGGRAGVTSAAIFGVSNYYLFLGVGCILEPPLFCLI